MITLKEPFKLFFKNRNEMLPQTWYSTLELYLKKN